MSNKKKNKCLTCEFGSLMRANICAIYKFRLISKKRDYDVVDIDYSKNESGCRKTEWNDREEECLKNKDYILYSELNFPVGSDVIIAKMVNL